MIGLPFAGVLVACVGLEGVGATCGHLAPFAWQIDPFVRSIWASAGEGSAHPLSRAYRPLVGVGRGKREAPLPAVAERAAVLPVSDGSSLACSQSVSVVVANVDGLKSEAV